MERVVRTSMGVTPSELRVLMEIFERGPIRQVELLNVEPPGNPEWTEWGQTGMSDGALSVAFRRLSELGYIEPAERLVKERRYRGPWRVSELGRERLIESVQHLPL